MNAGLEAFLAADFQSVRQLRGIWKDVDYGVNSLNDAVVNDLLRYFELRTRDPEDAPIGRVMVGPAGAGKTHLLGRLRQRIWEREGSFVLLDFAGVRDFWATTALCFVNSLDQTRPNGETQYERILKTVVAEVISDADLRDRLIGTISERRAPKDTMRFIDLFLTALERHYRGQVRYADVVRAMLLLVFGEYDARNIAYAWLQGDDLTAEGVGKLGFLRARQLPIELVRGMSWFMSLAGPTLIAVDQIDAIVSEQKAGAVDADAEGAARSIVAALMGGLMELHDVRRRAVTLVSCLEETWNILTARGLASATHRFSEPQILSNINHDEEARRLVAARLAPAYAGAKFTPPNPTWPIAAAAFADAIGLRPRQVLRACEDHQRRCEANGRVDELLSFAAAPPSTPPAPAPASLDARFAALRASAEVAPLLTSQGDDPEYGGLIVRMMQLYRAEIDVPDDVTVSADKGVGANPPLHARLTFAFHSRGERERQFAFRAIGHKSALAFQARLRAAMTASGVDRRLPFRQLVLIRSEPIPGGARTQQMMEDFRKAGARQVARSESDLRIFIALDKMAGEKPDGFEAWLREGRPLRATDLFKAAGLDAPVEIDPAPPPPEPPYAAQMQAQEPHPAPKPGAPEPPPAAKPRAPEPSPPSGIPVGRRLEAGAPGRTESIPAGVLSRHVAILAGAGSGKTVLLRRLVEEAALARMPGIVIDCNNDLARLGEPWPERPPSFTDADAAKAQTFEREAEVVLWTPGLSAGRPLSLALLPNFAQLGDDPDEREQAVSMAAATLEPFIGKAGLSLKRGVLADALRHFAQAGGAELERLIELLADLPLDASSITNATKHAGAIADQLRAAIASNPLLRSGAAPLDVESLFQGADGRTRVSVINLSGLASAESQLAFVNQLQMSLFTWIKRHPSPTGRIYALDEAQNFAPAVSTTPCKASTLALAAQARKYGLAMLFATQSPRGLDNKIIQNCTTQFHGKMSSPTAIEAIQELIAARGGSASDIGALPTGVFYFSTEGLARPVKLQSPLCLGRHGLPLTAEEVVARARG